MAEQSLELGMTALVARGFRLLHDLPQGAKYILDDGMTRARIYTYLGVTTVEIDTKPAAVAALFRQGEIDRLTADLTTVRAGAASLAQSLAAAHQESAQLIKDVNFLRGLSDAAVASRDHLAKEVERLNKALDLVPQLVEAVKDWTYYSEDGEFWAVAKDKKEALQAEIDLLRGGGSKDE